MADCQKDPRVLSNLGTIEIVAVRCMPVGSRPQQPTYPPIGPHPHTKPYWKSFSKDREHVAEKPPKPVFEKDIKGRGVSHRVATEPEKKVKRGPGGHIGGFIDSFDRPYCIMVIHYRSRGLSKSRSIEKSRNNRWTLIIEALQNMSLIPFTPAPSPAPSPEVTQDDLEQVKELSKEDMMRELLRYRVIILQVIFKSCAWG